MGLHASVRNHQKFFLSLLIVGGLTLLSCYYLVDSMYFSIIRAGDDENTRRYPSKSNEFLASELLIDQNTQSQADIARNAQRVLPNFPIAFFEDNKNGSLRPNKYKSCAKFPKVYDVQVNNLYWQILPVAKGSIYLFGAYYDVRKRCRICPAVRLLGMVDPQAVIPNKAYCQIWFDDNKEPIIVEGKYDRLSHRGRLMAYMITCSMTRPSAARIPICVSVVNKKCDMATNSLRVIFNKPADSRKKGFAVCVKNMDFLHEDQSVRLTEWIELVQLLGADKITFYTLHVHENMTKVLKYYEERDVVEIIPTTLAGKQANAAYFQHLNLRGSDWWMTFGNEMVQLNDCFYKNMYKYDYIVPIDVDEVIMPNKAKNWADLMNDVLKSASSTSTKNVIASYNAYMVIFPNCPNVSMYNDIPSYMYISQHVLADKKARYISPTVKSFLDTEITKATHNHRAIRSLTGKSCVNYGISRENGELYHYRRWAYGGKPWPCHLLIENNYTITNVWKYKESLINRTLATLYNLGFYGQGS